MSVLRAFAALAWATTLAACVEPVQYGGPIAVDEAGLGRRIRVVCGLGIHRSAEATCAPPASTALRGGTGGVR
ncbi:MAG: hypothetical protein JOZ69_07855 [Myxococcales bacterium]|nr:hypothetical protein [Myxococcales bacterium]